MRMCISRQWKLHSVIIYGTYGLHIFINMFMDLKNINRIPLLIKSDKGLLVLEDFTRLVLDRMLGLHPADIMHCSILDVGRDPV